MKFYYEIISFFQDYTTLSTICRMLLAVVCAGIIGMERGRHGRAAGLRTHVLVSLGAAISAIVGLYTTEILGYSNDPMRIGAQVVSGIGFLGVGTIIVVGKSHVRGLTTAAGLWATAAIGLASGVGYVQIAVSATLIISFTLTVLCRLETTADFESNNESYYLESDNVRSVNELVRELRSEFKADDIRITAPRSGISGHLGIQIIVPRAEFRSTHKDVSNLENRDGVVVAVRSW